MPILIMTKGCGYYSARMLFGDIYLKIAISDNFEKDLGMVIQHNLTAMNSNRQLTITTGLRAKSSEKLSSGYKINRAADDAAGLSISEKMRRQIRGLDQGSENLQDGVSMVQTAEGALQEIHEMLQRISELTVKASNDTLEYSDKVAIQQEINQLLTEIDRVGSDTKFNDIPMLGDIKGVGSTYTKLTDLVQCSAADTGYLSEAYEVAGKYHPAATINFSGVNAKNIHLLDDKGFSFVCPQGCGETFQFTFETETADNSFEGSTSIGSGTHHFHVGLADCTNGGEIIDKMWDFIIEKFGSSQGFAPGDTSLKVAHDNMLVKTGGTSFAVYAIDEAVDDPQTAKTMFKAAHESGSDLAKVDCSSLTGEVEDEEDRKIWIQASAEEKDGIYLTFNRIDGRTIGVRDIDVTTHDSAMVAIDKVKKGIEKISAERANLGAQQNRLEHSYANNRNIEENTTAAESRIRDTDMAAEMVKYSNENILAQAGQSMLAQANQTNQGVLSLLQ